MIGIYVSERSLVLEIPSGRPRVEDGLLIQSPSENILVLRIDPYIARTMSSRWILPDELLSHYFGARSAYRFGEDKYQFADNVKTSNPQVGACCYALTNFDDGLHYFLTYPVDQVLSIDPLELTDIMNMTKTRDDRAKEIWRVANRKLILGTEK